MVNFDSWAIPALEITLGGKTYTVAPPSVARAKKILACAVRGEVNLGLAKGPVPPEVQAVLDTIGPDDHPALDNVYHQMVADGVDPRTIDRVAYYAIFYWARSKQYADWLAAILWTPRDEPTAEPEVDDGVPKASATSDRSTGRGSESASLTSAASTPSTRSRSGTTIPKSHSSRRRR